MDGLWLCEKIVRSSIQDDEISSSEKNIKTVGERTRTFKAAGTGKTASRTGRRSSAARSDNIRATRAPIVRRRDGNFGNSVDKPSKITSFG